MPKPGTPFPFPQPHREETIILGWTEMNNLINELLLSKMFTSLIQMIFVQFENV